MEILTNLQAQVSTAVLGGFPYQCRTRLIDVSLYITIRRIFDTRRVLPRSSTRIERARTLNNASERSGAIYPRMSCFQDGLWTRHRR